MVIAVPMNEVELRNMMYSAQLPDGSPFVIRYPRGAGVGMDWHRPFEKMEVGVARKLRDGNTVVLLSVGDIGNAAAKAIERLSAEGIAVAHYDMRFVKPIDEAVLHEVAEKYKQVVTLENGAVLGGFGSAVAEFFTANGYNLPITRLGIPDRFVEHGTIAQLHAECGIDEKGIYATLRRLGEK
jgi:1-deoxy-D-xylulose-5-phosphate synthase